MRTFLVAAVAALCVLSGCSSQPEAASVRVLSETTVSCRGSITASLDAANPNNPASDGNGVMWVQVSDGFELRFPSNIRLNGGLIMDPTPTQPLRKAFRVIEPEYGRTVRFTYEEFPMANHGILCISRH